MVQYTTRMRLISTLITVFTAITVGAQPPTASAPWVSLFNGKDYTGWKLVGPTNLASASIEDGAMVLRQRINTAEHTFVTSTEEYRDFILELDLKDDPGFNSGILLRAVDASVDAKVRLNAYQVKINNTPLAWTGGVFDDFGDSWRWLHDLANNEAGRAAFKLGGVGAFPHRMHRQYDQGLGKRSSHNPPLGRKVSRGQNRFQDPLFRRQAQRHEECDPI